MGWFVDSVSHPGPPRVEDLAGPMLALAALAYAAYCAFAAAGALRGHLRTSATGYARAAAAAPEDGAEEP